MESYLVETFVTLAGVCALALVVLWGARRLGVGRPSGPIELCGHLPLDARRAIYLVRVGQQMFVLGVGEGGFTKLGGVPASELPGVGVGSGVDASVGVGAGAPGTAFGDVLGRVLKGRQKT
jgi:flagellar biogenesis protein FliO